MLKYLLLKRKFTTPSVLKQQILSPTIYALSTAPARSAIGVVRISGPATKIIFNKLTGTKNPPQHRVATVRKIYNIIPQQNNKKILLDECLMLYFQSPKSYTGEDLLELHLHGGIAVINKVMETISRLHTSNIPIRLAEPGEFSKRAFQNQRFDLTEVEGINTLIHADTEMQRISALTSMKGETNIMFNKWREMLVKNIALLTTVIDFGEDHDIEEINDLFDNVSKSIVELENEINSYLIKVKRSQVLLDGIKLTLTGPPNAGKSSLLNLLAHDDKAIVSSIAGTTRDAMEVPLDINGYKVIVSDTAGIRESLDIIENEGIKRAKKKSLQSDINVLILPSNELDIDLIFLKHAIELVKDKKKETIIIINKSDLFDANGKNELIRELSSKFDIAADKFISISCTTQDGIDELINQLTKKFQKITSSDKEDPVTISNRAREILSNDVLYGFSEFHKFKQMDDIVLACEGLKTSIVGIGKITGEAIGVEEILGVVFSKFCIGK